MTTAGRFQVTFMADQAALIALLRHEARISHAYQSVRRRNARHAAVWGLIIAAAFAVWGYMRGPDVEGVAAWTRALTCVAIFAVAWVLFAAAVLTPPGFYRLMDRLIQRRIERGFIDCEAGPQVLTLVEEGIVCEDSWAGDRLALWSEVQRIVPEPDAVYIDLRNGSVFRIPRTAFRGDDEFRRFIEFACGRVGQPDRTA